MIEKVSSDHIVLLNTGVKTTDAPSYVRYRAPGCPQVTTVQLVFM